MSATSMAFVYNDGGRAAAGLKGDAGDCVCRALAIVTRQPYVELYHALAELEARYRGRGAKGVRSARNGIHTTSEAFKRFARGLGLVWTPTMKIGSGCKVHLDADELPSGRLAVVVSKHYTAVINGVIHDTFNPSDRPATFYHVTEAEATMARGSFVPKGAVKIRDGHYVYAPKRCVYGYWAYPS